MPWWYEVPGARPGRGAERFGYLPGPELVTRLDALHQLAPRRPPVTSRACLLFAAATDAELETAAQAHEAQARQLRDPAVRAALRGAWQVVDPLRSILGRGDPMTPLADVLALAPPELAAQTRAELAGAGLDPDATGWPPGPGPSSVP